MVRSDVELTDLAPGSGDPDISISLGPVTGPVPRRRWAGFRVRPGASRVELFDDEVGTCSITRDRITFDPLPGAQPGLAPLLLMGPAIAILLQLRGLVVLHASAVKIGARAVVVAGDSGMGKSTTAAALLREGGELLADDVVAITSSAMVLPGARQVRLMPETLLAVGEDPAALPRLRPDHAKRRLRPRAQPGHAVPLASILVLAEGVQLELEDLEGADALGQLLRQSYCADLLSGPRAGDHFARCGALAASTPVRWLHRPRSLDRLAELAALVERAARRPAVTPVAPAP